MLETPARVQVAHREPGSLTTFASFASFGALIMCAPLTSAFLALLHQRRSLLTGCCAQGVPVWLLLVTARDPRTPRGPSPCTTPRPCPFALTTTQVLPLGAKLSCPWPASTLSSAGVPIGAIPDAGASVATRHCDQPDCMLAGWSATTFQQPG